jgi:hypothetical protein
MRPISSLRYLLILLLLTLVSCVSILTPAIAPAPTENIQATQTNENALVATVLANRRTQEALQLTLDAQQKTQEAREIRAQTATGETLQQQETQAARATDAQQTRQAKSATVVAQATEQVRPIHELVQRLYEEGVISTTEGNYHRLDDFDQSWAQINWYQWWRTGLKLENFIVRVDAEWESASKTANWFSSGCGFVFSENGTDYHFASFLALDGNVYNSRVRHGISSMLPGGYYGRLETPSGSAELTLVIDQTVVNFYVNGKRAARYTDSTLSKGDFALTLNSGTNLDYGTRCKMNNIDVWELK